MNRQDLAPGMKFRFSTDPKGEAGEIFTVQAISPFVDMIKIKENGFWVWLDNIMPVKEETSNDESCLSS